MKVKHYKTKAQRRQVRVRSKITGTAQRPRLSVDRSNLHLAVQLIDDVKRVTLFGLTTHTLKKGKNTKTQLAEQLGEQVAKKAQELQIKEAVFDRGSYRYHGRLKAFAESARKNGLKI